MTVTPQETAPASTGKSEAQIVLRGVVASLLTDLKAGTGDRDKRRQVEEWMKSLAEKYPEFGVESGLRDYYLAEADRLKGEFEKSTDLTEKLNLGRSIEMFLDKAAEYASRNAPSSK